MASQISFDREDEDDAINEDPNFYRGTDEMFNFPNGDVYVGDYLAHSSGLVWREGKGTYYTADGQTYQGTWYNDELSETDEVEINYPNGYRYIGKVKKCHYFGPAMYTVEEGLHLLCNFFDNKPAGEICLLDIRGREWRDTAGENDALLLPEHTFFNDIPPRLGKGTARIQKLRLSIEKKASLRSLQRRLTRDQHELNKLELKIFAKAQKTLSDLKFEQSSWNQNWLKFKTTYDNILYKITTMGEDGLCQDERDWLEKYRQFKNKFTEIMDNRKRPKNKNLKDYKLFELYKKADYMPPISVFATDWEVSYAKEEIAEQTEPQASFAQSFGYQ